MGKLLVLSDEHAELVVVHADVLLDHVIRSLAIITDIIVHEIQYHARVVHCCLPIRGLGKAIVVIPRLHHLYEFVYAMVEQRHA